MSAFPTLPSGRVIDGKKYSYQLLDTTIRQETEGSYTITRPRSTRALRKLFSCAYTQISDADKGVIEAFVQSMLGGAMIFDWYNPQEKVIYQVRFKSLPKWEYAGFGSNAMWNCAFELEQV